MRVTAVSRISIASLALIATIAWDAAEGGAKAADTIEMPMGFAQILRPNRTFHTIVIGDPRIVDATIGSGQMIVLTAKREGATNLIVLAGC
jgi:Flp pilus assembly secretin CpaC